MGNRRLSSSLRPPSRNPGGTRGASATPGRRAAATAGWPPAPSVCSLPSQRLRDQQEHGEASGKGRLPLAVRRGSERDVPHRRLPAREDASPGMTEVRHLPVAQPAPRLLRYAQRPDLGGSPAHRRPARPQRRHGSQWLRMAHLEQSSSPITPEDAYPGVCGRVHSGPVAVPQLPTAVNPRHSDPRAGIREAPQSSSATLCRLYRLASSPTGGGLRWGEPRSLGHASRARVESTDRATRGSTATPGRRAAEATAGWRPAPSVGSLPFAVSQGPASA